MMTASRLPINLQIERVEKQNQVFALVVLEADLFEFSVVGSCTIEVWSLLGNCCSPSSRTWNFSI